MADITYRDLIRFLDNAANTSGVLSHDYSLKVGYILGEILEEKHYNKEAYQDFVLTSFLKDLLQPPRALLKETLDDGLSRSKVSVYNTINTEILKSLPNLNSKERFFNIIKYQALTREEYERLGRPEDFPPEVSVYKLAKAVVLCDLGLKDLDSIYDNTNDFNKEDITAFRNANEKEGLLASLQDGSYKAILFSKLNNYIPSSISTSVWEALAISLDFRNPYTSAHTEIMKTLCSKIAEKVNLMESEKQILNNCAILSGIGRFMEGLSEQKTEEPSKEESILNIKKNIIAITEIFKYIKMFNYKHTLCQQFEYLNGTGLPLGLCGDEINIYGKILSLGNRFCELIEGTSYKSANTKEEICRILSKEAADGKFDKEYVSVLIDNEDEIFTEINRVKSEREKLFYNLMSKDKTLTMLQKGDKASRQTNLLNILNTSDKNQTAAEDKEIEMLNIIHGKNNNSDNDK